MSTIPPSLSVASAIVGFISFAFTFLTLLRVTWNSLQALVEAPDDVKYAFANLKSALHEEREHLRQTARYSHRRRSHSGGRGRKKHNKGNAELAKVFLDTYEGAAQWRVISDTVRRLCRQFKEVERPFLTDAAARSRHTLDEEKAAWDEEEREYATDSYIDDYRNMTLNHRFLWLWKKGEVAAISNGLMRVQTRRIAQETSGILLRIAALEGDLKDLRLVPHQQTSTSSDEGFDDQRRYRTERVHVRRSYRD